jgi:HD-like signal output (HDOD) protein/CheY-like chemotaxis protein
MTGKLRIVFVDDEPHVLHGLRRSMGEMEDLWDMRYCHSAAEALALLEEQPADVVVSDMRMPQMDGAQFLEEVRHRYPQAIRVILSGYAETRSVLKTVEPTHIYLAKPCDPELLQTVIARPLALRRFMTGPALLAAVGGLSNLPSLPSVYHNLVAELARADSSAASVAKILSQDIAMTAEILKLTNSSFFAVGAQVTSALQAVKTLGLDTIQTLVLHVGIFRQLDGSPMPAGMLADLTRYSLETAALAEAIIRDEGGECAATAKAAYCAGLLSSIGALVFLDQDAERYGRCLAAVGPGMSQDVAETAEFGASHGHVGAYLLGLWGFADAIVEAVAFSASPSLAPCPDNPVLLATHAACALGPRFPLLPPDGGEAERLDMAYLIGIRRDGRVRHWRELAGARPDPA